MTTVPTRSPHNCDNCGRRLSRKTRRAFAAKPYCPFCEEEWRKQHV